MSKVQLSLAFFVALGIPALSEQPLIEGKPDFSGEWQSEESKDSTWVIEQTTEGIHVREITKGDKPQSDLQCGVRGEECSGRFDGNDVKAVFYYNGPKLVQMTTKGRNVSKVSRTLSADGQRIDVEIVPFVPEGKTETYVLKRADAGGQQAAASSP